MRRAMVIKENKRPNQLPVEESEGQQPVYPTWKSAFTMSSNSSSHTCILNKLLAYMISPNHASSIHNISPLYR